MRQRNYKVRVDDHSSLTLDLKKLLQPLWAEYLYTDFEDGTGGGRAHANFVLVSFSGASTTIMCKGVHSQSL